MEVFNLQVPESELKQLLSFYEDKKREIVRAYKKDIEGVDAIIKQIKGRIPGKPAPSINWLDDNVVETTFNSNWTWKKKIESVLALYGTPLTAAQILEKLSQIDKVTIEKPTVANRSVSGTLSTKSSQGDTFTVDKTGKENLYGLKIWLNGSHKEIKTSEVLEKSDVF